MNIGLYLTTNLDQFGCNHNIYNNIHNHIFTSKSQILFKLLEHKKEIKLCYDQKLVSGDLFTPKSLQLNVCSYEQSSLLANIVNN